MRSAGWLHLISWLGLLTLLTAAPSSMALQTPEQEAEATKAQLEKIAKELERREAAIGQRAEALSVTERKLKQLELQIDSVANELNTTTRELAEITSNIQELEERQRVLQADLKQQSKWLAEQIDMAYRIGDHDFLKLIFNQQNPATLERLMGYYRYFNDARLIKLDELTNTQQELEQVAAELQSQRSAVTQKQEQQRRQQGVLQAQQSEQKKLAKRLAEEQQADQKRVAELQQNQEALEQVLAAIMAAQRDEPKLDGLQPYKGKLSWPTEGRVRRLFGTQRSGGVTWKGILIEASEGAPVRAIADGRVLFANWLRGFGLLIVLDHGDGYMSLYGHNQSILPGVGEIVRQNDTIALVGQSGGRSEPALYFEIRNKGDAVNPTQWCR